MLISAKEAKEYSLMSVRKLLHKELEEIGVKINEAIKNGDTSIAIYDRIDFKTKYYLIEELGYGIKEQSDSTQVITTIYWK